MAQHFLLSAKCRDFSRSELNQMSDKEIIKLMAKLRWGHDDKQVCPACGVLDSHYERRARSQWRCKHRPCGRDFSVTSGTPYHGHKLPLRDILSSLYTFVVHANGVSATMLGRELGCQWKTAWLLQCKLREVIIKYRSLEPMSGVTQMDGGHFGGKRRSANKHGYRNKETIGVAIAEKIEGKRSMRNKRRMQFLPGGKANLLRKKKRRVVMVLRELYPEKGRGASRTIVYIANSENEADAVAFAREYVVPGSTLMTDESGAFTQFSRWFDHQSVQHSLEWQNDQGVNDNQAESYFSRLRRSEYGVYHGFRPMYLTDYANEMAWREDTRRDSMKKKFMGLLKSVMNAGFSRWFGGYYQGNRRQTEIVGVARPQN